MTTHRMDGWSFRTPIRLACYLTCLILHICVPTAHAEYRFDVWNVDNGLPQNVIRSIVQTEDGYLWVTTFYGLARFDGVHFTIFNKSNTPGLASNRFAAGYKDHLGDLWFVTEAGGITRLHQGIFQTYGSEKGVVDNIVRGITGDKDGHIWILTVNTIAEWNEEAGRFTDVTPKGSGLKYQPLAWGENEGFWTANKRSLEYFLGGHSAVYALPSWLSGTSIWGTARERDGTLWLELIDGRHVRIAPDGSVSSPYEKTATYSYTDSHGHSGTYKSAHIWTGPS